MNSKLLELILYVAQQSQNDPAYGVTKLNKILFIADFYAYGIWGSSITDATYVRMEHGPYIDNFQNFSDELLAEGQVEIQERTHFGYSQKRLIPRRNPDLSVFSLEELQLVDQVLEECKDLSASELREWSHELRPWLDAGDGKEIPYHTIFVLRDIPAGFEDIEWGEKRLKKLIAAGDA